MFSYTGLTEKQCVHLINQHHIHMMKNGRMAMVGLNTKNVEYVARAMNDAVVNIKWFYEIIVICELLNIKLVVKD